MPLLSRFYPLFRPLLFKLDPEVAHDWTVKLLKTAHVLGMLPDPPPNPAKARTVFGLNFPNCVGLAAGMDKSASAVDAWGALGFGHVEVGTLTPRPQPGNPTPRLFRLVNHEAIINRMGFNNPGIEEAVQRLERRTGTGIVGVNIGKNYDTPLEKAVDDYLFCLRAAYHVADYIAVNISSPNTRGLRDLQAEEPIRRLLGTLKAEQQRLAGEHGKTVPLLVKIAPDLTEEQIEVLAKVFVELGIEGAIATNTTISREGVKKSKLWKEHGGLSGKPLLHQSTAVLATLSLALKSEAQGAPVPPIIGVGGIMGEMDAEGKLQAGASLVQLYSGLVYRGPRLVTEVAGIPSSV